MKTGENMHYANNIDESYRKMSRCRGEEMLIRRAKTFRKQEKTYKFLECIGDALKINPYSSEALAEIAAYLKEEQHV